MEQGNKVLLWKSSFASVGFLQNPLSLFLTFLNKYNSFHCRLEKWNSHRTNDRFFGQRKAKAFVKSSVYFADRLMTSKRSRSLFFTAWKTFLQQQATNNTLAKSPVPFYLKIYRAKKISRKVKGNSQFMQKISYPCDNVWISGFLTSSLEMQR